MVLGPVCFSYHSYLPNVGFLPDVTELSLEEMNAILNGALFFNSCLNSVNN